MKRPNASGSNNHRFVTQGTFESQLSKKFGNHRLEILEYNGSQSLLRYRCKSCKKISTLRIAADLLKRKFPCFCAMRRENDPITCWEEEIIEYLHVDLNFTTAQIAQLIGIDQNRIVKYLRRVELVQDGDELNSKRTALEYKKNQPSVSRQEYGSSAHLVTSKIYNRYRHIVDPKGKRGTRYHLDHILSISDGYSKFDAPLSLRELCHPANLAIITATKNCSKSKKSGHTILQLRRKIQQFEKCYGIVEFPEYWSLDFSNLKSNKVSDGINILSMDPGTSNFGVFGGVLYGAKSLHRVKASVSTMLRNPIKDLRDSEVAQEKFRKEIKDLCLMTSPDFIVMERFQARGLRGTTGELVSFMIGLIAGMLPSVRELLGKHITLVTPIASQWKNAVNRVITLDDLYSQLKPKQYHRLDAALLGMSIFPVKNPYEGFSKQRQQKLVNLIQRGDLFPEGW